MARVLRRSTNLLQSLINSTSPSVGVNGSIHKHVMRHMCQVIDGQQGVVAKQTGLFQQGESRHIDPVAAKQTGIFHFDTLAVCRRLKASGFQDKEAEALTEVLADVVGSVVEHQNRLVVTKPQQEIMVQQLLSQIASVKKDMVILEKSEFTMIRNDTEKQGIIIKQLETQLADGIKKLGGQVKLDLNLEKSRAVEAHALNEKQLLSLVNRLEVEHAQSEKNLQNLNNKIDIEVSNLRTQNEKNRNDVQKYLIGLVMTSLGLYMAYLRLIA